VVMFFSSDIFEKVVGDGKRKSHNFVSVFFIILTEVREPDVLRKSSLCEDSYFLRLNFDIEFDEKNNLFRVRMTNVYLHVYLVSIN